MVFVTVGNATQGFKRLLDAVDEAAGKGVFGNEPVFIQTGNNPDFRALHCKHQAFIEPENYETLLTEASLVISHGGAGTLIRVLRAGKIPVVMPRLRKYGEVIDDHQVELVKALAQEGRLFPAFDADELAGAVRKARQCNKQIETGAPSQLVRMVASAIDELGLAKRVK